MTRDALEVLIERSDGDTRPERVVAAMRSLTLASAEAAVLLAELICEATEQRYYLSARATIDRRYRSSADYFSSLTGLCRRSIQKYLRLGRAMRAFPMTERNWLRTQLAQAGIDRALFLARVIERHPTPAAIAPWLDRAAHVSAREFRRLMFLAVPPEPGHPLAVTCPTCHRPWRKMPV